MSQPSPGLDDRATSGTPRWVKVFGIIALVVVVLLIILQLTGVAGDHSPGRHNLSSSHMSTVGITRFGQQTP